MRCVIKLHISLLVRPTLIDMNPVELKYFQFMISLNKCTGSCNILSPKILIIKRKQKTHMLKHLI